MKGVSKVWAGKYKVGIKRDGQSVLVRALDLESYELSDWFRYSLNGDNSPNLRDSNLGNVVKNFECKPCITSFNVGAFSFFREKICDNFRLEGGVEEDSLTVVSDLCIIILAGRKLKGKCITFEDSQAVWFDGNLDYSVVCFSKVDGVFVDPTACCRSNICILDSLMKNSGDIHFNCLLVYGDKAGIISSSEKAVLRVGGFSQTSRSVERVKVEKEILSAEDNNSCSLTLRDPFAYNSDAFVMEDMGNKCCISIPRCWMLCLCFYVASRAPGTWSGGVESLKRR